MAFVDEIQLHISAGKGGDGVVRWKHEKSKEFAGPGGGNGGKGGDVFVVGVRNLHTLSSYRQVKEFEAGAGQEGANFEKQGAGGKDLVLEFPIGSFITNLSTKREVDLLEEGKKILLLSGGRGGVGNAYFKSSVNQRPKKATKGERGEEADFLIELRLIADVGLVGLPNAGKSSLLNSLTKAKAKIGDYPFTTLEPNIGSLHGYIIADIPGLIEGASEGRGLGHKFLRHISRTKIIAHCISVEEEDIKKDYKVVKDELLKYNRSLGDKKEIIILTKSDTVHDSLIEKKVGEAKELSKDVFIVSVLDDDSVKKMADNLVSVLQKFS